jgi:hypothetical protein
MSTPDPRAGLASTAVLDAFGVDHDLCDADLDFLLTHVAGDHGFVRPLIREIKRRRAALLSADLAQAELDRDNARQALELATGPFCSSCGNAIDPDCCWCGSGPGDRDHRDEHAFVPIAHRRATGRSMTGRLLVSDAEADAAETEILLGDSSSESSR